MRYSVKLKYTAMIAAMIGITVFAGPVHGEQSNKKKEAAKKEVAGPDLVKEAEVKLRGSVWAIKMTPISGGKDSPAKEDRVSFDGGKIVSDKLSAEGYGSSNYTLTVGDDGVPVWETMQSAGDKGLAFWRGELHGEMMRGILSKHATQGPTEDYSFSGTRTSDTANVPEPKSAPAPALIVTPLPPAVEMPPVVQTPVGVSVPAVESQTPAVQAPVLETSVETPTQVQVTPPIVTPPAPPAVSDAPVTPEPSTQTSDTSDTSKKRRGWLW